MNFQQSNVGSIPNDVQASGLVPMVVEQTLAVRELTIFIRGFKRARYLFSWPG